MRKVVFLDRDGVINNDTVHYYIYKPDDFVLNEGLILALQKLASKGFEFVVITNQGGIARGTYTKSDVLAVHQKLIQLFNDAGIELLEIYYCPHHDKYESCLCRKPDSLMLEKAIARFQIDKELSVMIGDNAKDVKAAGNAGIRGILIAKNDNLLNYLSQLIHD